MNSCGEPSYVKAHGRAQQRAFSFASFICFLQGTHEGCLTGGRLSFCLSGPLQGLHPKLCWLLAECRGDGAIPTPRLAGLLQVAQAPMPS